MKTSRVTHVGVNFNNTTFLKAQLEEEITKLERQLHHMHTDQDGANFAMLESYKEMIHSRRDMLQDLSVTDR